VLGDYSLDLPRYFLGEEREAMFYPTWPIVLGGLQPGSAQIFPGGGEGGNVLLNMAHSVGGLQPGSAQIFPGGGEGDNVLLNMAHSVGGFTAWICPDISWGRRGRQSVWTSNRDEY